MIKKLNGFTVIAVVALLVVLGAVGFVNAIDGSPTSVTYVIENNTGEVNFIIGDASQDDFDDVVNFGSSGTRFPNGISADSTSPSAGEVRGTTFTLTGAADVSKFTQGGSILATSSTGIAVGTTTEAQLLANISIDMTLSGDNTHTLGLPNTSTMTTLIPNAGDMFVLKYRVIGTAVSASSTIEAGVGIDLVENENGDVEIEAGNEAILRFIRESDTDVTVFVDEYIAAD